MKNALEQELVEVGGGNVWDDTEELRRRPVRGRQQGRRRETKEAGGEYQVTSL